MWDLAIRIHLEILIAMVNLHWAHPRSWTRALWSRGTRIDHHDLHHDLETSPEIITTFTMNGQFH